MTTTCVCEHEEEAHGADPEHLGAMACSEDGCAYFEYEVEDDEYEEECRL